MSMRKMIFGVAVTLGVVHCALAASVAQASDDYRQATFKAEVKGVQTYKGEYHHPAFDLCDPAVDSVITERVRFASAKPAKLTVTQIPGTDEPILSSGMKALKLKARAKVTRAGDHRVGGVPDFCPDNGGGVTVPPSADCGTRNVPLALSVGYYKRDRIEIVQPSSSEAKDPFRSCGGGKFPFLLGGESFGRSGAAELPARQVFDKRIGKLITIGRGNERIAGGESYDRTDIRWELSLKRVR
jgi:hypothetical protein